MTDVAVLILHPTPAERASDIEMWVGAARAAIAERHRVGFRAAGASEVTVLSGPPDGRSFGSRLASFVASRRPAGLVVLGSGAIPMATPGDRRAFVAAASSTRRVALANNRYSADVIAVARAGVVADAADLATDNALPRWLAENAGYEVDDLRRRWRLGVDIDGPLNLALLGRRAWLPAPPVRILDRVAVRLAAVGVVAHDPLAELVVAGRVSAAGLGWLERSVPARVRALVEERGMRTAPAAQRRPRSVLGLLLGERAATETETGLRVNGTTDLGAVLAQLGDAALVDSRVLVAHRFGADERAWPTAEDRFASDLLLHERVADDWLRSITRSAATAPIPIVLGGHSLVGPGLRLALGPGPGWT